MRQGILLWCLCGAAAVGHAQQNPAIVATASPITDHFAISGGYFREHVSTTGRFDSNAGVSGTSFSAERDLGLPDYARQARMEVIFRMRERSRLRVEYFDISRRAAIQINRTINYGSQTYQINDLVQSELDWRQMSFNYTYSVFRTDRFELGAGLGVYLLQGEALANVPARQGARADFTGAEPFATPAVDGTWRISRRFALSGRAQYLHLNINGSGGSLGEYHADLQYRWFSNLALGLGWGSEQFSLDEPNSKPPGTLHMTIRGPDLFVRASF